MRLLQRCLALLGLVGSTMVPGIASTQPADVGSKETVFGVNERLDRSMVGQIFYLPPNTNRLPDFSQMTPVGSIFARTINIPQRAFSEGFPGVTDRFEWFAIEYRGTFSVKESGEYTFRTVSDDGSKLFVDQTLVVNNDGVHPTSSRSGKIQLEANKVYRIRIQYFQGPRYHIAL